MNTGGKKCYQAFANIKRNGKKINKKIHNDIYCVASIYYQISMNVQHSHDKNKQTDKLDLSVFISIIRG